MNSIKSIRKSKGMTQLELANKVGYQRSMISEIERGHRTPSSTKLMALADALEVKVDELRGSDVGKRQN